MGLTACTVSLLSVPRTGRAVQGAGMGGCGRSEVRGVAVKLDLGRPRPHLWFSSPLAGGLGQRPHVFCIWSRMCPGKASVWQPMLAMYCFLKGRVCHACADHGMGAGRVYTHAHFGPNNPRGTGFALKSLDYATKTASALLITQLVQSTGGFPA